MPFLAEKRGVKKMNKLVIALLAAGTAAAVGIVAAKALKGKDTDYDDDYDDFDDFDDDEDIDFEIAEDEADDAAEEIEEEAAEEADKDLL